MRNTLATLQSFRVACVIICLHLAFACWPSKYAHAQTDAADTNAAPKGEEITVGLTIARLGTYTIPAILVDDDVYLPVADLFRTVSIKADPSVDFHKVSGFFIEENKLYEVNIDQLRITLGQEIHALKRRDYIVSENNLYLRRALFGEVFAINCSFDFRALEVTLKTELELPAIRDMLREEARKNLGPESADFTADTTFRLQHLLFDGGVLDWSINANELPTPNLQSYSFNFGGQLLYGETNALITGGYNNSPRAASTVARWRFVDPENPIFKQIILGNNYAFPSAISLPSARGFYVTNTPVTNRRAFGTYTISDITQPNWIVELYLNSRLIDFTRTDASGYYHFAVPIVYGATSVKLKFYGLYGEERTEEKQIQIPYTFLPAGTIEYSVLGGQLLDPYNRFVSGIGLNAGISYGISIGGGIYYLPDSLQRPWSPYASASVRLTDQLLFRALYAMDFQYSGTLSFSSGPLSMEASYNRYSPIQHFVHTDILEDRKLSLSLPFHIFSYGVLRLSALESISPTSDNITIESGLSASLWGLPFGYTLSGSFLGPVPTIRYGALTSGINLLVRGFFETLIRPSAEFDHTSNRFSTAGISIDKTFGRFYAGASYQRGLADNSNTIRIDARLDLNFAQFGTTYNSSPLSQSISSSARGTLAYDAGSHVFIPDSRTLMGRGGLTIRPFLDRNDDGIRNDGEPLLKNLDVHIANGRILQSEDEPIIRVVDLEPYKVFLLKTSGLAFESLSWRPSFETAKVTMEANRFKTIDIPVFIAGEASGRVDRIASNGNKAGLEDVGIVFLRDDGKKSDSIQTMTGGEFDYFGLRPGKYHARVDGRTLRRLGLESDPESIPFEIRPVEAGDIVEKLNFRLTTKGAKK